MKRPQTKMRMSNSPNNRQRKDPSCQLAKPKGSADKDTTNSNYTRFVAPAPAQAQEQASRAPATQKPAQQPATKRAPLMNPPASPNEEKKAAERMKANKELKGGARKKKSLEKEVEKKTSAPAGTARNRKKPSSGRARIEEGKSEDGPKQNSRSKKKKVPSDPSLKREREKSSENPSNPKSSNSKEPSEEEREIKTKVNKSLVRKMIKEMQERRTAHLASRRPSTEEIMPETSQLTMSVRAMKKKMKKNVTSMPSSENTSKELTELFKPNGEPVWVVYELPPGSGEMTEDGTEIRNPELAAALADDNLELDDKTEWADVVGQLVEDKIKPGMLMDRKEQLLLDPYAEFEEMKKNDEYLTPDTTTYLTAKGLYDMSLAAVHRYDRKKNCEEDDEPRHRPNRRSAERIRQPRKDLSAETTEDQLKTCYEVKVDFDLSRNSYLIYERGDTLNQRSKRKPRVFKKLDPPSMEMEENLDSKE